MAALITAEAHGPTAAVEAADAEAFAVAGLWVADST